jgi:small-conductance mechanosensitive channel
MSSLKQIAVLIMLIAGSCQVFAWTGISDTTNKMAIDSLSQDIKNKVTDTRIQRSVQNKAIIDSLRNYVKGCPVLGVMNDTIFYVYSKLGASTPAERADLVTNKIRRVYQDDFFKSDSISVRQSDYTVDVVYGDIIIIGVSELDALWFDKTMEEAATDLKLKIRNSILKAKENYSLSKVLSRIGLAVLVFFCAGLLIWLIGKASTWLLNLIARKKNIWLKKLSYKDYTFLTAEHEYAVIHFFAKIFRWLLYAFLLYLTLPIIFSIFPFTRGWADSLFSLIWNPFKGILVAVWKYLPNLFSILVIIVVMRLFMRFIKYLFTEIELGKLKIAGFHADWAMTTHGIARFLLYAFTFVLIFPHLPGSDSAIFKGVSVFLGLLFSLGSPSVIANAVAGIVITYMRPFKIGDRIKIGDITGDVIEKTLLVTRLRTIKNEEITLPNTSVLTGSTTNYSSFAKTDGLIIYTTVTIGYDVPWKDMHKALIDAALQTNLVLREPKPFVLQTSLDDFYVSYQINAYINEAVKMAEIYSDLHRNIQDVCNERGIEIMSPHYMSARDGNMTTIPSNYLPEDYKEPAFNVRVQKERI